MKSEVKIQGPNWKIIIPITLATVSLIAFLSWWFEDEMRTILIAIGVTLALLGVIGVLSYAGITYFLLAEKYQHLRIVTYQADKAQLEAYVLSFPKTQRLVTLPDSNVRVIEALAEPARAALLPASTQEPVNLLPALDSEQRVLIVGASNSGKTELLKWLAYRRSSQAQVVIIDPHASMDKWPNGQVIGIGRNYQEIDRTLEALVQLMQKRYKQIGTGEVPEGQHKPVCCIVDEWRAITGNLPDAGDALKTLLTESRKASMSMFVASHSDRARPLGLSGEYDLKDGFVIVRLAIIAGQRQASIDNGNGEIPARLPGPFTLSAPVMESDDFINLEVEPNPTEAAILTLHRQGQNHKIICETVGWTPGGKQYGRIDEVLAKFSL